MSDAFEAVGRRAGKTTAQLERANAAIARAAVEVADLLAFDCLDDEIPSGIDVPDDFEAGVHYAAQRIKDAFREPQ